MLILMWYIVQLYQISDVPFENKSSPNNHIHNILTRRIR